MNIECSVAGGLGFVAFEALRVYKRMQADQPAYPPSLRRTYWTCVVLLGVVSAFVSEYLAGGNMMSGFFIGFSVPNGFRALTAGAGRIDPPIKDSVNVDDIEIKTVRSSIVALIRYWQF